MVLGTLEPSVRFRPRLYLNDVSRGPLVSTEEREKGTSTTIIVVATRRFNRPLVSLTRDAYLPPPFVVRPSPDPVLLSNK